MWRLLVVKLWNNMNLVWFFKIALEDHELFWSCIHEHFSFSLNNPTLLMENRRKWELKRVEVTRTLKLTGRRIWNSSQDSLEMLNSQGKMRAGSICSCSGLNLIMQKHDSVCLIQGMTWMIWITLSTKLRTFGEMLVGCFKCRKHVKHLSLLNTTTIATVRRTS